MYIKLLHASPLWLASHACRMSHDNHDRSDTGYSKDPDDFKIYAGEKDKELIERVGNKLKHKSIMEQLVYWFDIYGISRACLMELSRHRTARLTVKSTRYTLKQIKEADDFTMSDYLVMSENPFINESNLFQLYNLKTVLRSNVSNDVAKYLIPEAFKTRLQFQIDGRNFQNFLELRTSKDALPEIRELAMELFSALPEEHKYLYQEYVK